MNLTNAHSLFILGVDYICGIALWVNKSSGSSISSIVEFAQLSRIGDSFLDSSLQA